ncbi:hypothetical protein TSUD_318300 [Trifolium subterraneum]|uniref:RNase H type-1 domain-containing protein n=1 Tax=Trifolium subterraneum TaxID=3900 RepID=A0A2Z6NJD7_TRISU|nr:hypothetical protein TSUD_318300 [Trifolium subterraneum]
MVETFTSCFVSRSSSAHIDRYIRWNSDNHPCVILNVDGFSGFIQNSPDILLAELYAIFHGLTLAKDMNFDTLICSSDSLHCINLIKGPNIQFHVHAVLIQDIKDMLSHNNITISHILKEGNHCADFLANLGASSDVSLSIHASPPKDIFELLRSDAVETFFLRE